MKFCSQCGKELKEQSLFCTSCGVKLQSDEKVSDTLPQELSPQPIQRLHDRVRSMNTQSYFHLAIPLFGILSVFMPWFSNSKGREPISYNGFSSDTGMYGWLVFCLFIFALIATVIELIKRGKLGDKASVAYSLSGSAITALMIDFRFKPIFFAETDEIKSEMGLILSIIAGLGMVAIWLYNKKLNMQKILVCLPLIPCIISVFFSWQVINNYSKPDYEGERILINTETINGIQAGGGALIIFCFLVIFILATRSKVKQPPYYLCGMASFINLIITVVTIPYSRDTRNYSIFFGEFTGENKPLTIYENSLAPVFLIFCCIFIIVISVIFSIINRANLKNKSNCDTSATTVKGKTLKIFVTASIVFLGIAFLLLWLIYSL